MAQLPAMLMFAGALKGASSLVGGLQQAQAAAFNRRQALLEADARNKEAARQAELATEQARRVIGEAEVAAGASGFTLGGSAADVLGDLAGQQSYDTRAILHQGAIERAALLDEAAAQKRAGQGAMLQGVIGAGASVLGGIAGARAAGGANLSAAPIAGDASSKAAAAALKTKQAAVALAKRKAGR
jgi:hypothetical protein